MAAAKKTETKREAALKAAGDVKKGHSRFLRVSTVERGSAASSWRAKVRHTATPVDHPLEKFDDEQQEMLFDDPKLKVEIVDVKDTKDDKAAE